MRLFLDTASIDEIREINRWGVLKGVTTNPSLVAKENEDPDAGLEGDPRRGRRRHLARDDRARGRRDVRGGRSAGRRWHRTRW